MTGSLLCLRTVRLGVLSLDPGSAVSFADDSGHEHARWLDGKQVRMFGEQTD